VTNHQAGVDAESACKNYLEEKEATTLLYNTDGIRANNISRRYIVREMNRHA